jgi:hypothetical protein
MSGSEMRREPVSPKMRFEVLRRDSFTCRYCGQSAPNVILHIDHITPVSNGGVSDISNLVTACSACNYGKGASAIFSPAVRAADQLQQPKSDWEFTYAALQIAHEHAWHEENFGERARLEDAAPDTNDDTYFDYTVRDLGDEIQ